MTKITCFIANGASQELKATVDGLRNDALVGQIYILGAEGDAIEGAQRLDTGAFTCTETLKKLPAVTTPYVLLYIKNTVLQTGLYALERLVQVAGDTDAGLVYADYYEYKDGQIQHHPVIDYQDGSLRDDFGFGSVLLYEAESFTKAIARMDADYEFAALYDLRLKVSQSKKLFHINEYLYTEMEQDNRSSGQKLFDYVDPRNRGVQIEMEKACTRHLKDINAWLAPDFKEIKFDKGEFPVEASVVIPVRNRAKTIADAVKSVLSQTPGCTFNLIVVDNHSNDGTSEILQEFAAKDNRLIHIQPERTDLGIGGCWNVAVMDPRCGKFAIQLDSDDLYIDNDTIRKVVDAFYEQQCGMVVGTYQMVNFKLEEIPPGVIDHKEWTPDNGRNNALRINGLGAPRAFYTPLLRSIKIPNTSYGEDYAVGLAISREHQIGRIYTPLYLCRRWDENSDAALDIVKQNNHNTYKDRIRTMELWARQALLKK